MINWKLMEIEFPMKIRKEEIYEGNIFTLNPYTVRLRVNNIKVKKVLLYLSIYT